MEGEFTRSFSYNAANELTEITEGPETTSFTYDALGRQTGKSRELRVCVCVGESGDVFGSVWVVGRRMHG